MTIKVNGVPLGVRAPWHVPYLPRRYSAIRNSLCHLCLEPALPVRVLRQMFAPFWRIEHSSSGMEWLCNSRLSLVGVVMSGCIKQMDVSIACRAEAWFWHGSVCVKESWYSWPLVCKWIHELRCIINDYNILNPVFSPRQIGVWTQVCLCLGAGVWWLSRTIWRGTVRSWSNPRSCWTQSRAPETTRTSIENSWWTKRGEGTVGNTGATQHTLHLSFFPSVSPVSTAFSFPVVWFPDPCLTQRETVNTFLFISGG